ncbi:MAG: hypothetical protein BWK80_40420 [Desulfobacteraceae bacterium IS3]|nr:MAG: hypothetical protein BWK80_40420 [Desulfobacteraceae bacterium IS3]
MKSYFKQTALIIALMLTSLCVMNGCMTKRLTEKQNRIEQMSDTELKEYYHGINEKIKDLDAVEKGKGNPNYLPGIVPEREYMPGGQIYDLYQIRELIVAELRKRNIRP